MRTIAILSQKGGSGKTTAALHLAMAAHQAGKQVLVADLDPQASASTWHGVRVRAGHGELPHVQPVHPAALGRLLTEAERQGVDLAIIDTAPQSDTPAVQAAELADLVLITCRPSALDLRAVTSTIRMARLAERKAYAVLTQVGHGSAVRDEATATLRDLGAEVLPCSLGQRVAFQYAMIDGRTVTETEPLGKAADEVQALYGTVEKLTRRPGKSRPKPGDGN